MKIELWRIGAEHMEVLIDAYWPEMPKDHRQVMLRWGRESYPLYSAQWGGDLLALVGLVPPTLLSDTAYFWCHETELVAQHKIAFGRRAHRLVAEMRQLYPKIIGECLTDSSRAWLQSLGAVFHSPTVFEIAT